MTFYNRNSLDIGILIFLLSADEDDEEQIELDKVWTIVCSFEDVSSTAEASTPAVVNEDDEAEGPIFSRGSSVDSKGEYSPVREPEWESVGTNFFNLPFSFGRFLLVVKLPELDELNSADDVGDTAADTDCVDTSESDNITQRAVPLTRRWSSVLVSNLGISS